MAIQVLCRVTAPHTSPPLRTRNCYEVIIKYEADILRSYQRD